MDSELLRNGSGYVDMTAYKALMNVGRSLNNMEFERGEIFEYEQVGKDDTRKALVISADFRKSDKYISVILLTGEPKGQINVPIVCEGMMYADCGMVSFALNDRLGNFIRKATSAEMAQIDEGITKCLGIEQKTVEVPVEKIVEVPAPVMMASKEPSVEFFSEELATAKAEANVYKNLYEKLLAKCLNGGM